eukprot:Rmarinus@m.24679
MSTTPDSDAKRNIDESLQSADRRRAVHQAEIQNKAKLHCHHVLQIHDQHKVDEAVKSTTEYVATAYHQVVAEKRHEELLNEKVERAKRMEGVVHEAPANFSAENEEIKHEQSSQRRMEHLQNISQKAGCFVEHADRVHALHEAKVQEHAIQEKCVHSDEQQQAKIRREGYIHTRAETAECLEAHPHERSASFDPTADPEHLKLSAAAAQEGQMMHAHILRNEELDHKIEVAKHSEHHPLFHDNADNYARARQEMKTEDALLEAQNRREYIQQTKIWDAVDSNLDVDAVHALHERAVISRAAAGMANIKTSQAKAAESHEAHLDEKREKASQMSQPLHQTSAEEALHAKASKLAAQAGAQVCAQHRRESLEKGKIETVRKLVVNPNFHLYKDDASRIVHYVILENSLAEADRRRSLEHLERANVAGDHLNYVEQVHQKREDMVSEAAKRGQAHIDESLEAAETRRNSILDQKASKAQTMSSPARPSLSTPEEDLHARAAREAALEGKQHHAANRRKNSREEAIEAAHRSVRHPSYHDPKMAESIEAVVTEHTLEKQLAHAANRRENYLQDISDRAADIVHIAEDTAAVHKAQEDFTRDVLADRIERTMQHADERRAEVVQQHQAKAKLAKVHPSFQRPEDDNATSAEALKIQMDSASHRRQEIIAERVRHATELEVAPSFHDDVNEVTSIVHVRLLEHNLAKADERRAALLEDVKSKASREVQHVNEVVSRLDREEQAYKESKIQVVSVSALLSDDVNS